MIIKSKLKRWRNSLGVVLPKALVEEEGLREGEEVEVAVRRICNVRALRGKYPFKDLQHEKDEMRYAWKPLERA